MKNAILFVLLMIAPMLASCATEHVDFRSGGIGWMMLWLDLDHGRTALIPVPEDSGTTSNHQVEKETAVRAAKEYLRTVHSACVIKSIHDAPVIDYDTNKPIPGSGSWMMELDCPPPPKSN